VDLWQKSQKVASKISALSQRINKVEAEIRAANGSKKAGAESSPSSSPPSFHSSITATAPVKQAKILRAERKALDAEYHAITTEAHELALALPNLTSTHTPLDEKPRLISYINHDPNQKPAAAAAPSTSRPAYHADIGKAL
jgi:seryl-tRNA synthetase